MKLRLPLFGRFLIWLALNLVFLAVIFWAVLRSEFRLESLMAGAAGERVQQVADVLLGELRTRPRAEWDAALQRFSDAYRVSFSLINERGEIIAGTKLELPEEIRTRLRPPWRGGRGEPGRTPRDGENGPGLRPPPGEAGTPPQGRGDGPPRGGPRGEFGPRNFLHTDTPDAYWMLILAMLPQEDSPRPFFGRLVVMSPSLSAGGLFFDLTPWWIGGGAVLLLSLLWWLPFVSSITRSLGQMTAATEKVAEGSFDVALNDRRGDELGRLGGAINRMAGRLEGFVTGQKRFLGDIAHELCTPLARMEMALGVLDQRADEKQRDYVNDVRDEVRHMSGLVNELLSFSKAGLRGKDLALTPVELRPLLERVVTREAAADEAVQIQAPEALAAVAEPELLARAVGNLLRNALRYAGHAGPVELTAAAQGDEVVINVADQGPGVPPESLAKLCEPFYRPDAARTREQGGVGLGLAIVKSCVDACQGKLALRNRQPQGFEGEIRLRRAGDR